MRIGSEKRPPDDDDGSFDKVGRSFLEGGGPSNPGFIEVCFASSERRRVALDGPDLEPAYSHSPTLVYIIKHKEPYQEQKTLQWTHALQ